jgi:ABC-type glycerol-3-phosphate transport system substrate-binding protein
VKKLLLPVMLLVAALALAACGSSESDEDKIVSAIETSATSTDPADCTKFSTQSFMEQSTQESGAAAVKKCEKDAGEEENNAESVEVSNVEVEGSEASANAAITGGSFDGQTVAIGLVEEEGQWKLDEISEFVKYDSAKLAEAFEKEFEKPSSEVSESLASCVVEAFEEASQEEAEELILGGSSEPIEEVAEECVE